MMNWEIVISAKGLVAKDEIDSSLAYKGQAPRNDKKRSFHVIEGLAPRSQLAESRGNLNRHYWTFSTCPKAGIQKRNQ
jgi:hypothetical protein